MVKYLVAYGFSFVVGLGVGPAVNLFHRRLAALRTEADPEIPRVPWLTATVGIVERFLYTTVVAFDVSGAAGLIGACIVVKAAGGWATVNKGTVFGRATYFVGIFGSITSALVAIIAGIVFKQW